MMNGHARLNEDSLAQSCAPSVGPEAVGAQPAPTLREVSEGLLYVHTRLSQNTNKILENSAFLYGAIELLSERGLITIQELDERKKAVAGRLTNQLREKGLGVMLSEGDEDKYAFANEAKIDCENRLHICHAACCRLRFALSKQDVYEGIVRWELGQPYLIAQGDDGYCTHLDRGTFRCTVREQRPVACRGYDCRNDKRIWRDFENRIANPNIERADWPKCETVTEGVEGAA
jgi:Fe-S-cluster containining protein